MTRDTESERTFRRYLEQEGYEYDQPDRDDRTGKAADFRIFRGGRPLAVAEIKQWDAFDSPWPETGSVGTMDPVDLYAPVRKNVGKAATQLKAHRGEGLPLVVVLANPQGYAIPLGDDDVRAAIFGNPTMTFRVDPATGEATGLSHVFGRDGRLRSEVASGAGQHVYVSAVAIMSERTYEADWDDRRHLIGHGPVPQSISEAAEHALRYGPVREREKDGANIPAGQYVSLRVFESFSVRTGEAVPLSADVFNAPGDRLLGFTPDGRTSVLRGRNVPALIARGREAHWP